MLHEHSLFFFFSFFVGKLLLQTVGDCLANTDDVNVSWQGRTIILLREAEMKGEGVGFGNFQIPSQQKTCWKVNRTRRDPG